MTILGNRFVTFLTKYLWSLHPLGRNHKTKKTCSSASTYHCWWTSHEPLWDLILWGSSTLSCILSLPWILFSTSWIPLSLLSCLVIYINKISLAQASMLVFPLFFWEYVPNCTYFIYTNCYLCLILQIHGLVILRVQAWFICISWACLPSPLFGFSLVTRQINYIFVILCFLVM